MDLGHGENELRERSSLNIRDILIYMQRSNFVQEICSTKAPFHMKERNLNDVILTIVVVFTMHLQWKNG